MRDAERSRKRMTLADAVRRFVRPGMHVNFASTPSRSNVGILELARQFRGRSPRFTLSATGFHSLAHLLGLLRLGERYVACFFGDNCPAPRPNPLYATLAREGAVLENWSVLTYVTALRAAALGQDYGVTRSLAGTTLGAELAAAGRYLEVPSPTGEPVGLVAAMRPDITFVHAIAGDDEGRVLSSPPWSEGFWGAMAAKVGVIVTVEGALASGDAARWPELLRIPPERVLAVCVEPFGAHPQPLFATAHLGRRGYADDFEQYDWWRQAGQDPALLAELSRRVLAATDVGAAYRDFIGEERLERLRPSPTRTPVPESAHATERVGARAPVTASAAHRMLALAARFIARRPERTLLAGVGQSFTAARLAKVLAEAQQRPLRVNVETGLIDLDCGPSAHPFLLAHRNIAGAQRLGSIEDALGVLTCGADNHCLGVVGAAQIDAGGRINSTRLADGRPLVGSGGANDVASCADAVLVLSPCQPDRLVEKVDYVTSPGRAVAAVATDLALISRRDDGGWRLDEVIVDSGESLDDALARIRERCPWPLDVASARLTPLAALRTELDALARLDPEAPNPAGRPHGTHRDQGRRHLSPPPDAHQPVAPASRRTDN